MYNQPRHGYPNGRYTATPAASVSAYNYQAGAPAIRRQDTMNRVGSSSRPVYGAQPYGMQMQQRQPQVNWGQQQQRQPQVNWGQQQQQQQQRSYAQQNGMMRARSTPAPMQNQQQQSTVPGGQMGIPSGMKTYATTAGIPPEVESNPNVQYVRMNWEDILGGKEGLQGLQVSMAPGNGDPNANRQIRIGMGGAEQPNDGSTPLRIVSFQPVENYAGLKEPTAIQPGQPKFSVFTGSQAQSQGQAQQPAGQPTMQQRQNQNWGNVYSNNNRR